MQKDIHYEKLSRLSTEELAGVTVINIILNEEDPNSILETLTVNPDGTYTRVEVYASLKELATVASKELLTLYAKRYAIASDPTFFSKDDPRLHAFLSKLSYPAIETVCKSLPEFTEQFKAGKVLLSLPARKLRK